MRSHTLILFAPLALAAKVPRTQHAISTSQSLFGNILANTCSAGFEDCEDSCMPIGDTCCNDGTSESCEAGYYCIPDACCPKGQVCGGAGDDDDNDACDIDQAVCGDYCMPITGTCCDGQGYYCPEFGVCASGGRCCDLGNDCESSGNSSGATWTSKSLTTTSSVSSHSSSDDYTFVLSGPASTNKGNSSPTPTFTAETTHNDGGLVFPPAVTSNNENRSQPTQPFTTVTVTASSIPPTPGQAGGHHPANSRIVAGFAAVAAFFIQRL